MVRVPGVLEQLAWPMRRSRRVVGDDPAGNPHVLGLPVDLRGSDELGPPLIWMVSDFAPLLLKQAAWVASLTQSMRTSQRLLALVDGIWRYLHQRRLVEGQGAGTVGPA
ncbi:hypothetical protein Acor_28880 [Acrocarpospora corrugata]|uniref:Uncharacterized protein n=1 Tax=Acrocarpospora corrugata TaxID=35763 RepID=A0A5M3VWM0_9ACTN|nr:hypothetical protein [Acrocarpospora corrugata]GES00824.1 hypothetical protein Acor_28880 [Acrocarpospora corrugata]